MSNGTETGEKKRREEEKERERRDGEKMAFSFYSIVLLVGQALRGWMLKIAVCV